MSHERDHRSQGLRGNPRRAWARRRVRPHGACHASSGQPQGSQAPPQQPVEVLGRVPWPYRPLDVDAVAGQAFLTYQRGGCMLAVFEPVVRGVADAPRRARTRPSRSPCSATAPAGSPAGGRCAARSTARRRRSRCSSPQPGPLIAALFAWYEREALPDFLPGGLRFPNVPAVAGSLLCHASIAHWCKASGKRSSSPERAERCAALSGSVARKAVVLLNAQASGTLAVPPPDPATAGCLGCHGAQGSLGNAAGRMSCAPCHTPSELAAKGHPKV